MNAQTAPAYPPSPYSSAVGKSNPESHTLSVLVDNEPGVLARVIGLFSGRGFNIESLTVAEVAHETHLSRITVVTSGTPEVIEQISHQLERLVPVHRVTDLTLGKRSIERELAMVKVRGKGEARAECLRLAEAFRAKTIDATVESFIFEITGAPKKIDDFVELMRPIGLVEVSRTGVAAISRGPDPDLNEARMADWSETYTFLDGQWLEGNAPFVGARTHGFWLGSSVFDGARAFEGVAPDLEKHLARVNRSAKTMWLNPIKTVEEMTEIAWTAIKKFAPGAELYIRPMYWAEEGGVGSVPPNPETTRFALSVYVAPLTKPTGASVTRSRFFKPLAMTMPVEAKAGCLYPNNARALMEARARGFDNCLMADMLGNVAELATANVFMARGGKALTPAANGAFLNGVTRQRVLGLLGSDAEEATLSFEDFDRADEIFVVGNFGKVTPVTRIDGRDLQPGPLFRRARQAYWDFAHAEGRRP